MMDNMAACLSMGSQPEQSTSLCLKSCMHALSPDQLNDVQGEASEREEFGMMDNKAAWVNMGSQAEQSSPMRTLYPALSAEHASSVGLTSFPSELLQLTEASR